LVSKLLQAIRGGRASDFHVSVLHDRVFKFVVSSKQVGFHVYKLHSYTYDFFKLYFHQCGNVGPAWIREYQAYEADESNSWTYVQSRRTHSFAEVVKSNPPLTGANCVKVCSCGSVFNRLSFLRVLAFQCLVFPADSEPTAFASQAMFTAQAKNTEVLTPFFGT